MNKQKNLLNFSCLLKIFKKNSWFVIQLQRKMANKVDAFDLLNGPDLVPTVSKAELTAFTTVDTPFFPDLITEDVIIDEDKIIEFYTQNSLTKFIYEIDNVRPLEEEIDSDIIAHIPGLISKIKKKLLENVLAELSEDEETNDFRDFVERITKESNKSLMQELTQVSGEGEIKSSEIEALQAIQEELIKVEGGLGTVATNLEQIQQTPGKEPLVKLAQDVENAVGATTSVTRTLGLTLKQNPEVNELFKQEIIDLVNDSNDGVKEIGINEYSEHMTEMTNILSHLGDVTNFPFEESKKEALMETVTNSSKASKELQEFMTAEEIQEMVRDMKTIEDIKNFLRVAIDHQRDYLKTAKLMLESFVVIHHDFKKSSTNLENQLITEKETNESQSKEIEQLRSKVSSLENENKTLKKRVKDDAKELKKEKADCQKRIDNLSERINTLQDEIEKEKERHSETETKQNEAFMATIKDLKLQLTEANRLKEECEKDLQARKALDPGKAESLEISQLKTKLQEAERQKNECLQKIQEETNKCATEKAETQQRHQEEVDKLQQSLLQTTNELQAEQDKLGDMEQKKEQKSQRVIQLEEENRKLRDTIQADQDLLKEKKEECKKNVQKLESEKLTLEQTMEKERTEHSNLVSEINRQFRNQVDNLSLQLDEANREKEACTQRLQALQSNQPESQQVQELQKKLLEAENKRKTCETELITKTNDFQTAKAQLQQTHANEIARLTQSQQQVDLQLQQAQDDLRDIQQREEQCKKEKAAQGQQIASLEEKVRLLNNKASDDNKIVLESQDNFMRAKELLDVILLKPEVPDEQLNSYHDAELLTHFVEKKRAFETIVNGLIGSE